MSDYFDRIEQHLTDAVAEHYGQGTRSPSRILGRWPRWAGPALAVTVAVVVAAVALISIRSGGDTTNPAKPNGSHNGLVVHSIRPMRGELLDPVLGFGPSGTGVAAWIQKPAPGAAQRHWLAVTANSGRSWSITARRFLLSSTPMFSSSRDAWASGVDAHQRLRFFVTHDAGRTWSPAPSAGATNGELSVVDGVTWGVGTVGCASQGCTWVVVRGRASGNRLGRIASQPLARTDDNDVSISAVSATTAYVTAPNQHSTAIYVTHDSGRHWTRVPGPCKTTKLVVSLVATGDSTLWRVCGGSRRATLFRSSNGGTSWSDTRLPFAPVLSFEPVSPETAWAQDAHGTVYRTTDGGVTWQSMWRASDDPHEVAYPGLGPVLSAQSATQASILLEYRSGNASHGHIPRSTNFLLERTTDGGRTWKETAITLPHG